MTDKQTSKKEYPKAERSRNTLRGKVVLLVGEDTAVMQALVTPLADKGADIALISHEEPSEVMHSVKESVESSGRRFLFLEQEDNSSETTSNLVQSVIAALGQLDIFIDLSAHTRQQESFEDSTPEFAGAEWMLTRAVLEEMTV